MVAQRLRPTEPLHLHHCRPEGRKGNGNHGHDVVRHQGIQVPDGEHGAHPLRQRPEDLLQRGQLGHERLPAALPPRRIRPSHTPPCRHALQHDPPLDGLRDRRGVLRGVRPTRHHGVGRLLAHRALHRAHGARRHEGVPRQRAGQGHQAAQPSLALRMVRMQRGYALRPPEREPCRHHLSPRRRRPPLSAQLALRQRALGQRMVEELPSRGLLRKGYLGRRRRPGRPRGLGLPQRAGHGGLYDVRELLRIHARGVLVDGQERPPERYVGKALLQQPGSLRRCCRCLGLLRCRRHQLRTARRSRIVLRESPVPQHRGDESHLRGMAGQPLEHRLGHPVLDEPARLSLLHLADIRLLLRCHRVLLGCTEGLRAPAHPVELQQPAHQRRQHLPHPAEGAERLHRDVPDGRHPLCPQHDHRHRH